jgi:uncharacterized membrane protein
MAQLFLHTLHIIVVIIWMGVLLFMPILFIYQMNAAEISAAEGKPAIEQCKKISRHFVDWIWLAGGHTYHNYWACPNAPILTK